MEMRRTPYSVIVTSVLLLTAVVAFFPPEVFAGELTKPVITPTTNLTYRDITDLTPTADPTISLDKDKYKLHDIAILTIDDTNANLDIDNVDFTFATVSGSSLTLTETDINSHTFTGSFEVGTELTIDYTADSPEAARAKITLPLSSAGNAELSDVSFSESEIVNLGIKPVTGAINIELVDGASFSSVPTVEISFANANLDGGTIHVGSLEMWHKAPDQAWEKITDSCFTRLALSLPCTFFDNTDQTITSDPAGAGFSSTDGQGAYVLAIDTGIVGGGGGGLVRPSLVVNVLAGVGGFGSGGADGSPPIVYLADLVKYSHLEIPLEIEEMVLNHDSTIPISPMDVGFFENFDYPMTINDKGFVLGGFSNTIETQTITTDSTATIKFTIYETTKIQHISLYTNLRGANSEIHQSDVQILYNDGQELRVTDPNGYLGDVSVTINDIDENKKEAVFEISFAKEMDKSDIIIRSWDSHLNSRDVQILDAIEVVPEIIEESPAPTFEEPIIEEIQSQSIPMWVKNNAGWWSDQQIGDSDFVSGIEYLIKNEIINVPGVQVGTTSATTEIPDWIKNNAGWWAESLITDDDFIEAMQWLIENGVIQI